MTIVYSISICLYKSFQTARTEQKSNPRHRRFSLKIAVDKTKQTARAPKQTLPLVLPFADTSGAGELSLVQPRVRDMRISVQNQCASKNHTPRMHHE